MVALVSLLAGACAPAQEREITRDNVARLEIAWTYRTGEADARFATTKPTAFEATPVVVDNTMYVGTPLGRVIALDAATGYQRWVFDPEIARDIQYGDFASRGVSTWLDESAPVDATSGDGFLLRRHSRSSSLWMRATERHARTSASTDSSI